MLSRDDLARAVRVNDRAVEGGDIEAVLRDLGVEPEDVAYVAEQRATRLDLIASGRPIPRANEPVKVIIADPERHQWFMSAWLDGLAAGLRASRGR